MYMKTILSLDGGGMKGYLSCALLVELEKRTGLPCHKMFDMVAGTSIGGIMAALIATGKSATDVLKFFTEDGPVIFGKQQMFSFNGVFRPRYAGAPIERCLQNRFGKLSLADCKLKLLVPSFDLVTYDPFFFKAPPAGADYPLWQVARATSAAQSYFPAFRLEDRILWDGGNVANNPALCAWAEALKMWGDEPIRVVSVGCGTSESKVEPLKLINAGIAKIGVETVGLLFDANDDLPDYVLYQCLEEGAYFRAQPRPTHNLAIDGADPHSLEILRQEALKFISDEDRFLQSVSCAVGTGDRT